MEKIGTVYVDAGIVMVGDPCYTLSDDASHRNDAAKDWSVFCDTMFGDANYANGYSKPFGDGTAIVVESGWGDGQYPVFVERSTEGRVARLVIEFIGDEPECSYCSDPAEEGSDYCESCDPDRDEEVAE